VKVKLTFAHKYMLFLSPSICNKLFAWCLLLQEHFDIARTVDYNIPLCNNKCQTITNHCIILLLFLHKLEVFWCGVRDTFTAKRAEEIEKFENLMIDFGMRRVWVPWYCGWWQASCISTGLQIKMEYRWNNLIFHRLPWEWIRASTVRSRWLSAWTMTQSI
jgi:hypothetical protein